MTLDRAFQCYSLRTRLQTRNQSGSCYEDHVEEQMGWDRTELTSHILAMALDGHVCGLVSLHLHRPSVKKVLREPASVALSQAPGA